jgi:hypothetical protein
MSRAVSGAGTCDTLETLGIVSAEEYRGQCSSRTARPNQHGREISSSLAVVLYILYSLGQIGFYADIPIGMFLQIGRRDCD